MALLWERQVANGGAAMGVGRGHRPPGASGCLMYYWRVKIWAAWWAGPVSSCLFPLLFFLFRFLFLPPFLPISLVVLLLIFYLDSYMVSSHLASPP